MKISLNQQIEEVEYELSQRASIYPRLNEREPRRRSERELHVNRMKAVKQTLEWLRENEARIRAAAE